MPDEKLRQEVYRDAFQPATREIGVVLGRTVHAVLAPVRAMVWGAEKIEEYVDAAVSKRFEGVPHERIQVPALPVAGPALEALRFAGTEPSLRELYINLLATAMDLKTAEEAHPAFVEILKQLTPDEAKILKLLATRQGPRPVISLYARSEGGRIQVFRHCSLLAMEAGCAHRNLSQSYLENLCRLQITDIPYGFWYKDPEVYRELENHPEIVAKMEEIKARGEEPKIDRQTLDITIFGQQFLKACVADRPAE
jgi:hypothetical protein